jgi:hypothetical protein
MTLLRRSALLWLFMFWQGGFLFYRVVVVTVGSAELGSDFALRLITRRVTDWLNLTGVLVLLAWTWDLQSERTAWLSWRWGVWAYLMLTLAALAWLHVRMEALVDADHRVPFDDGVFHHLRRWYLRISTAQWLGSVVFVVLTLANWRAVDRTCNI